MSALQTAFRTFYVKARRIGSIAPTTKRADIDHAYACGWFAGRDALLSEQIAKFTESGATPSNVKRFLQP